MACDRGQVDALLDGELAGKVRADVEGHLRECSECAKYLAELRDMRAVFDQAELDELTPLELARLHAAIDAAVDAPIWRLGGLIGAVAASILIISAAWLAQMPPAAPTRVSHVTRPAQDWEKVAMTLRVDVPSGSAEDQTQLAENADFMLDGLTRSAP